AREILREDLAVAVGDDAAGRGQRDGSQPVGLGLQLILRVVEDLRAEEHQHERRSRAQDDGPRESEPPLEQVRVKRAHASPRRIARCRPNSHSTRMPATAVVRLWMGDHTSSSQPRNPPLSFPDASTTARLRHQVPAKNRQPFTNMFSAKNTALLQEERYPTSVCASAPAPNDAGVSASRNRP